MFITLMVIRKIRIPFAKYQCVCNNASASLVMYCIFRNIPSKKLMGQYSVRCLFEGLENRNFKMIFLLFFLQIKKDICLQCSKKVFGSIFISNLMYFLAFSAANVISVTVIISVTIAPKFNWYQKCVAHWTFVFYLQRKGV